MYATEQPVIAAHARTPEGLTDVVTFAIATMNQRFYHVGEIVDSLNLEGLGGCKWLTESQKRGVAYVRTASERLLARLHATRCPVEGMRLLVEIPNMGIVKAGFVLQMIRGQVGCLDTRHMQAFGLRKGAFATPATTGALTQKLHAYYAACTSFGTPEALWDGWCQGVALDYPQSFLNAQDVSAKHVLWCHAA